MPRAHDDAIAGLQFDDVKCVTASFDGTVKIWDLRAWKEPRVLPAPVQLRCTRLAFDDTRIVTGSLSSSICCFDVL